MKITFSHRIIGAFLTIAVLLIFVGYFAFVTASNLQKVSRAILKENVSSLKAAEELEIALLSQKGLVGSYFLDSSPSWLKTLEDRKNDFEIWFHRAQEVALTANEKEILKAIFSIYRDYDNQRSRAIRLFREGNTQEAKRILLTDMKNSTDSLYQKCEELIFANEALIAEAESSSRERAGRMTLVIWVTIAVTLLLGGFMGFFTARKINEQFVRSAKMASLGQLSANIAHEIRNPLTSVKMRLYTLREELKENVSAKEDIAVIYEEIGRMEKTVKDFLNFAKLPAPDLQRSKITPLIESVLSLLAPKATGHNVQIRREFNSENLEAVIDKEQIRQALMNVVLNAIEAMPSCGMITIGAGIREHKGVGRAVYIAVKDNGGGIPAHLQRKIMEPFYT